MSENKCCENCKYFKDEDSEGWGCCSKFITQQHAKESECTWYIPKIVANHKLINGWIKLTPDNADEINADLIVVTDGTYYKMANDWHASLSTLSKIGGLYYYVLPELKIE